jgi:hypothetical protein
MEQQILIVTTENDLEKLMQRVWDRNRPQPDQVLADKVDREEALKLLGISTPTIIKMEKAGIVKRYGSIRKPYYFRSELIEMIRNMHAKPKTAENENS